ncbi:hypothetical protein FOZ62_000010 [Perkinsus olseni]|uniref:Cyclic nucleotide-binding domain-containing protein n=1 Tax=Perkinsus olseni TaxID=32597 RepID=A0A7J6UHG9_PEROL|nr:hypothetical protein FOZ62_000010 [Perkinsus olseni]
MVLGTRTSGMQGSLGGMLALSPDANQGQLLMAIIERAVSKTIREVNADVLEAIAADTSDLVETKMAKMLDSRLSPISQQLTEIHSHLGINPSASPEVPAMAGQQSSRRPQAKDTSIPVIAGVSNERESATLRSFAAKSRGEALRQKRGSHVPSSLDALPPVKDEKKFTSYPVPSKRAPPAAAEMKRSLTPRTDPVGGVAADGEKAKDGRTAAPKEEKNLEGSPPSRWRVLREIVFKSGAPRAAPLRTVLPDSSDVARDRPGGGDPKPPAEPPVRLLPGTVPEEQPTTFRPGRVARPAKGVEKPIDDALPEGVGDRGRLVGDGVAKSDGTKRVELKTDAVTKGSHGLERSVSGSQRSSIGGGTPRAMGISVRLAEESHDEGNSSSMPSPGRRSFRQGSTGTTALSSTGTPQAENDGEEEEAEVEELLHVQSLALRYREELVNEEMEVAQYAVGPKRSSRAAEEGHRVSGITQHRSKRLKQDELERMMSLLPDEAKDRGKMFGRRGSLAAIMADPLAAMTECSRALVADPHSQTRLIWDLTISTLHMYQATTIPFALAFYLSDKERADSPLMNILPVSDVVFGINILVTCFTGFYMDGALVREPKILALRYLKTWFLIDLVGAFPYVALPSESAVCQWLRLLRLLIIGRTGYLRHQIMSRIEHRVQSELLFILLGIVKLVMLLILVAHWGACIWWAVGASGYLADSGPEGWITEFGLPTDDLWQMSRIRQYTACLYFMTSTITTVGYGDIHAVTHSERVFCVICEIIAGNLFALFSGLLCSLILTYDEVGAQFRARLKTAMRYMNRHNVDHGVQIQVRRFLERLFQNQANEQAKSDLLALLRTSEGLQNRVLVGVMGRMLKNYKWFDVKITDAQLGRVASVVLTKYFAPGDLVFYAGDKAECMIFVVRGLIKCKRDKNSEVPGSVSRLKRFEGSPKPISSFLALNGPRSSGSRDSQPRANYRASIYGFSTALTSLVPGDYVGEKALFTDDFEWPDIAVCTTFCEVYELDRQSFIEKCVHVLPDLHDVYLEKCLFMATDNIASGGSGMTLEKIKQVEELLVEGASANSVDEDNRHIICEPASQGQVEILLLLLGFGANVNFFLKPRGDHTPANLGGQSLSHRTQNVDAAPSVGRHIWNRAAMRTAEEIHSGSLLEVDREESGIYGNRMTPDRLAPLQMAIQSGSIAAVATLARHTSLLILQQGEDDHPLAAMRLHNKGPSLDPMAPILKAPLIMRYEVLAAAVMQGCQSIAMKIITDGKRREQSTGVPFDVMRLFYGYEAGAMPILPVFRVALPAAELAERYGHDTEGRNLIHLAAESGQVEMLEFLINTKLFPMPRALEAFTEPNPEPQVEMPMLAAGAGHTPLHLAAIRGNIDIVTSLVDAGVSINITNRLGQTILDVAVKYEQEEVINFIRALDLYDAAKQGDMGIFENLDPNMSEHVKSVNSHHPKTGSTPLYIAAGSGHVDVIKKLIELKAEVDKPMPSTFTALHGAVSAGHADAVRVLLEVGGADPMRRVGSADVDKGQLGISPLETALKKGKSEVIDLLYKRVGAQGVSIDDLRAAAQKKNFAFFDRVIADHPPLLNEVTNALGEKLAHVVVKSLDEKGLDELKKRGVDFATSRALEGHSTLHSACKANKANAVKWLLGPKSGCKGQFSPSDLAGCLSVACGMVKSKNVVSVLMPLVKVASAEEGKYYGSCMQSALEVGNSDVCLMLIETLVEKIDFQYVEPWSSFLLYYVTKIGDVGSLKRVLLFLVPDFDILGSVGCDARRDAADSLMSTLDLSACQTALQDMTDKVLEKLRQTPEDKKLLKEEARLEELADVISDLETRLVGISEEQKPQMADRILGAATPRAWATSRASRSFSSMSSGRARGTNPSFRSLI